MMALAAFLEPGIPATALPTSRRYPRPPVPTEFVYICVNSWLLSLARQPGPRPASGWPLKSAAPMERTFAITK